MTKKETDWLAYNEQMDSLGLCALCGGKCVCDDDEITEVIPDVERRMREQYEASVDQDSAGRLSPRWQR